MTALAFGAVRERLAVPDELAARVADGGADPEEAAEELLASAVIFQGLARTVACVAAFPAPLRGDAGGLRRVVPQAKTA